MTLAFSRSNLTSAPGLCATSFTAKSRELFKLEAEANAIAETFPAGIKQSVIDAWKALRLDGIDPQRLHTLTFWDFEDDFTFLVGKDGKLLRLSDASQSAVARLFHARHLDRLKRTNRLAGLLFSADDCHVQDPHAEATSEPVEKTTIASNTVIPDAVRGQAVKSAPSAIKAESAVSEVLSATQPESETAKNKATRAIKVGNRSARSYSGMKPKAWSLPPIVQDKAYTPAERDLSVLSKPQLPVPLTRPSENAVISPTKATRKPEELISTPQSSLETLKSFSAFVNRKQSGEADFAEQLSRLQQMLENTSGLKQIKINEDYLVLAADQFGARLEELRKQPAVENVEAASSPQVERLLTCISKLQELVSGMYFGGDKRGENARNRVAMELEIWRFIKLRGSSNVSATKQSKAVLSEIAGGAVLFVEAIAHFSDR